MGRISRRQFLEDSLVAAALAAVPGSALAGGGRRAGRRYGPNDTIRVAVLGLHGRGKDHIAGFCGLDGVQVAALCDPDTAMFAGGLAIVEKAGQPRPKTYQDIRALLEDKEVDAVSIATPNHWHSLAGIWAMQAGKDVYVEKPVSHNVWEGRRLVEAARHYDRICQAGTQSHSSRAVQDAIAYMQAGKIGKVTLARALCYKRRPSIGKVDGPQQPPATVDYSLWLGPAPEKPVARRQFHYDWHWFWDYGNGDLGNQGIHQMDIARWGLGKPMLASGVWSLGGRFGYEDSGETPNTQLAFLDYGDSHLLFEVRGLLTDDLQGVSIGNLFYGSEGTVALGASYGSAVAMDTGGKTVAEFQGGGNHYANFIDAVRSRKAADLAAPVEGAHLSSALCHLANISYRLGKPQPFNKQTKAFGDDKDAYEAFERFEKHLAANNVALDSTTYRVGPRLRFDPKTETFIGDSQAGALLTRDYRKPFAVPERF